MKWRLKNKASSNCEQLGIHWSKSMENLIDYFCFVLQKNMTKMEIFQHLLKSVEDFDQFAFITHKNRDNAE